MLRIVSHIERLLLLHDCVIVPKVGGFVLQAVSSSFDEKTHLFSPSHKEISFNVTLQHNDGLLSEDYMQSYATNFNKAQLMIEEDVAELLSSLEHCKKLSLGILGTLELGDEGQLVYQSIDNKHFNIDSYGFESFTMMPLESMTKVVDFTPADNRKKDTFYIPVSRRLIKVVAVSAAAIALFLLISTPVKEVNPSAYKASFVPTEIAFNQVAPAVPEINNTISITPVETPVVEEAIPTVKEKEKAPSESASSVTSGKKYHIVIASFPTQKQADNFLSNVSRSDCANVNSILRDGKYRIYADRFDNREAAEKYMTKLRTNPKYKDAWLFISR